MEEIEFFDTKTDRTNSNVLKTSIFFTFRENFMLLGSGSPIIYIV